MKQRLHKQLIRHARKFIREKILSKHGIAVIARTKNGILAVEAGDFSVGRQLLDKGEYDFNEVEWLSLMLAGSAKTVVIIGAHIGALLVPLGKQGHKITAYEADEKNFSLLSFNVLLNQLHNVEIHQKAIGEKSGSVFIARNTLNTGNTTISTHGTGASIPMIPLQDAVTVEHVDLIIIDIEGYELHALKNAGLVLARTKRMYIEFCPEQLREHHSDPNELLILLEKSFSYVKTGATATCMPIADGLREVRKTMNNKGFLLNILCSKEKEGP